MDTVKQEADSTTFPFHEINNGNNNNNNNNSNNQDVQCLDVSSTVLDEEVQSTHFEGSVILWPLDERRGLDRYHQEEFNIQLIDGDGDGDEIVNVEIEYDINNQQGDPYYMEWLQRHFN